MWTTPHPSDCANLTPAMLNASIGNLSIPKKSQNIDDASFVKERIFKALLEQVPALSTDACGNIMVQTFFETIRPEQQMRLLERLKNQVVRPTRDKHGRRVVQKALPAIHANVQIFLAEELFVRIPHCVESPRENHVMQLSVSRLPKEFLSCIPELHSLRPGGQERD